MVNVKFRDKIDGAFHFPLRAFYHVEKLSHNISMFFFNFTKCNQNDCALGFYPLEVKVPEIAFLEDLDIT